MSGSSTNAADWVELGPGGPELAAERLACLRELLRTFLSIAGWLSVDPQDGLHCVHPMDLPNGWHVSLMVHAFPPPTPGTPGLVYTWTEPYRLPY